MYIDVEVDRRSAKESAAMKVIVRLVKRQEMCRDEDCNYTRYGNRECEITIRIIHAYDQCCSYSTCEWRSVALWVHQLKDLMV